MNAVFRFLASPTGRVVRFIAGAILIALGLIWVKGTGGWVLAIVGLIPLLAGLFDWCFFAPLFSLPFGGESLRKKVK